MTPYQQFRLWARRAPLRERAVAALVTAVVLALLTYVVVPGGRSPATVATPVGASSGQVPAAAGGAPAAGGLGPAAVGAPGSAGVAGSSSGGGVVSPGAQRPGSTSAAALGAAGTARTGASCASPPGTDKGVSSTEIKVAVTVSNIVGPAGNQTFGIPTASEQKTDYQDVIDAVNAAGGVACRRLVPTFYPVNPADQNGLQQTCLDIVASGKFAVLDPSAYAQYPQKDCYPQHQVPYFTSYFLPASETQKFYPYMFAFDSLDSLYHNTVFGLRDRGFFSASNGFKKLGFVYRSCFPALNRAMLGWLQQSGVSASQIVTYDVGCPAAFANPSDVEQAVLKFQENGVTHVTTEGFEGDFANFTKVAEQQHFHPKYGLGDEAMISVSYGSQHPDYNNIAGAQIVTASRFGEERTPGTRPAAATKRCNAMYAAHGQPPVYKDQSGFAGYICNEVWMFAAAVDHAPLLQRAALAAGLQAARSVEFSWPEGPNDFTGGHVTVAGQYWRVDEFTSSCDCWQVVDRTFHPSYR